MMAPVRALVGEFVVLILSGEALREGSEALAETITRADATMYAARAAIRNGVRAR